MREIHTHKNSAFTRDCFRVFAVDEPGSGGASHEYLIQFLGMPETRSAGMVIGELRITYQHGPLKEVGTNGVVDEALLAVIIDRMTAFTKGDFPSRETEKALAHIQEGLFWLNERQRERADRGVAGTLQK